MFIFRRLAFILAVLATLTGAVVNDEDSDLGSSPCPNPPRRRFARDTDLTPTRVARAIREHLNSMIFQILKNSEACPTADG
ncbi:hypothetical protein C8J56DRAFT_1041792 [Mycena floridula]|nr:hypothetical protein C8J56DRAFT_1041792 [Mycena floridula]